MIVVGDVLPISHTPNIPSLVGGAETYGRLADANGLPSQNFANLIVNGPPTPPYHSRLTIQTDANAAFGTAGDADTVDLYGTAAGVAEPTSLALLGLGGLALLNRRRA